MKKFDSASIIYRCLWLTMCVLGAIAGAPSVAALPLDTYASSSVLASGRWVKVSVAETGLHLITTAELRRYGFTDPKAVKVYGYGGRRLPDLLTVDEYVDDLTPVTSELTSRGLVFYARGPLTVSASTITGNTLSGSLNPYSEKGYYYLTDRDDLPENRPVADGAAQRGASAATTFTQLVHHEQDLVSPGESGHQLVGEDFRYTRSQTFTLAVPDAVAGADIKATARFVTAASATGKLTMTLNGSASQSVNTSAISDVYYGSLATISSSLAEPPSDARLQVRLEYSGGGSVKGAWLDAIDAVYTRRIALRDGSLCFDSRNSAITLAGAKTGTRVWDVTDPSAVLSMNTLADDGAATLSWVNPYAGQREYAAWTDDARLPSPQFVEAVANQDIHGMPVPDMIIFTVADWRAQAERLAEIHRNEEDPLKVLVLEADAVYNEFSSGTADVNAFRRALKMFYDRSRLAPADSTGENGQLRYALMFGRAIHDNRMITRPVAALREKNLPCWQTDNGLIESATYMTDDFIAALEDGAGQRVAADVLSIAVGRVPAGTVAEAKAYVDKVEGYLKQSSASGEWKNRVVATADDGDKGVHLEQTETMLANMLATDLGSNLLYSKIYVDAFDEVGGESVVGRTRLHRELEDGVSLWTYVGHGDRRSLSSEKLITFSDVSSMTTRRLPFLYAATCSFGRWDGVEKSGCELLLHNPKGGVIGAICPTREVYISENEYITSAFGRNAFKRDASGRSPRVGEAIRLAKNDLRYKEGAPIRENSNKLRFVLMGDPALSLVLPQRRAVLTAINGVEPTDENQVTIKARQRVTMSGSILNPQGTDLLSDFNGVVTISLFDAENTVTSQGRPSDKTEGKEVNFDQQGGLIYTGCDSIRGGKFDISFAMPSEVADNFRPATLSIYARATDGREATGCTRSFYVYGYDESAEPDTIAPAIEYLVLNHTSFKSGDAVNPTPMVLAKVSDNMGINIATAGIGHQMLLKVDERQAFSDVSSYYTPSADGSVGGTIAYPLPELAPGHHTLSFRVWDTSGNQSTTSIDFNVRTDMAPTLYDVYTDANPASIEANFYLSHNRPDAEITVKVEVFNLLGHKIWESEATDRSDMFMSTPLTWNLCDQSGRRVIRGIYLYRASVTSDGQTSSTVTRRIAVTGK